VKGRLSAVLFLFAVVALVGCTQASFGQSGVDIRIAGGEPFTWDPAKAGDSGSANVIAQVFEGLTAFDAQSDVQPALAESWQSSEDGRQITFHLRPGIVYSDGTPITAQDVVDNWLRIIDPQQPSPLASIVADIEGATEYQAGQIGRDGVGLRADGDQVVVDLRRPATYFLSVTASPSLAVMPPSMFGRLDADPPSDIVVSGAYVPSTSEPGVIHLTGNQNYWAGLPPLDSVDMVTDFGDESGIDAYDNDTIDFIGVGAGDASWMKYDATYAPDLRHSTDFTVSYYGFDTRVPPFDDPQVRLAFAKAVDWDRIVRLAESPAATSLVPAGVPGRDEEDHRPAYDPEAARQLLADATFPNGDGFPTVTLATYGVGFEQTVAAELEANLGVDVNVEAQDFRDYVGRASGPGSPGIFTMSWSADYPHPHDFLGLLLETGSTSNEGSWSNADYDALLEQAAATDDLEEQAALYAQAQEILEIEAPIVPVTYGESWALARNGLLGATESGVGIIRIAGLAWAQGTGR
jgi:oligopeptide transport system substrate-binding protein